MQTAARHRNENKHNPIAILPSDLMPRHSNMKIRIQTIDTLNASCGDYNMEGWEKRGTTIKTALLLLNCFDGHLVSDVLQVA